MHSSDSHHNVWTGNTQHFIISIQLPTNYYSCPLFSLCRTVCYLYQLTEPLHKLNPNISKLQCGFFFIPSHYLHRVSWERAATTISLREDRKYPSSRRRRGGVNMTIKESQVYDPPSSAKQALKQIYWLIKRQTNHRQGVCRLSGAGWTINNPQGSMHFRINKGLSLREGSTRLSSS